MRLYSPIQVHTPTVCRLVLATPPEAVTEPQTVCSVQELRTFILDKLKGIDRDAIDLEVRAAARINEAQAKVDEAGMEITTWSR